MSISYSYAAVFPGQGSQSVGMLASLATMYPIIEQTFAEASEVLGYDLWTLTEQGPSDILNLTIHTQPAMLAAGVAIWRLLQSLLRFQPTFMAGHSLGEYSALVCANAISFTDAIRLVAMRAQFMQEAVPAGTGGMGAIIGLTDAQVGELCTTVQSTGIVSPANFNSIGQVVVAGELAAVEKVLLLAKAHGAKIAKLLPVSVPSHCPLMQPAADRLSEFLNGVKILAPTCTVIHNYDVTTHITSEAIKQALIRQLYSPVRWVETIQCLANQGIGAIYELGPNKILTGLNKRIAPDIHVACVTDAATITELEQILKNQDAC